MDNLIKYFVIVRKIHNLNTKRSYIVMVKKVIRENHLMKKHDIISLLIWDLKGIKKYIDPKKVGENIYLNNLGVY